MAKKKRRKQDFDQEKKKKERKQDLDKKKKVTKISTKKKASFKIFSAFYIDTKINILSLYLFLERSNVKTSELINRTDERTYVGQTHCTDLFYNIIIDIFFYILIKAMERRRDQGLNTWFIHFLSPPPPPATLILYPPINVSRTLTF